MRPRERPWGGEPTLVAVTWRTGYGLGVIETGPELDLDPLVLAGVSFYGNPFAPVDEWSRATNLDRLRERYDRTLAALRVRPELWVEPDAIYEVHLEAEDSGGTGLFEVFLGQRIAAGSDAPFQLCVKRLGGGPHASFRVDGEDLEGDWAGWIARVWLPASPYVAAPGYLIQRRGAASPRGPLEVWVPVRRPT